MEAYIMIDLTQKLTETSTTPLSTHLVLPLSLPPTHPPTAQPPPKPIPKENTNKQRAFSPFFKVCAPALPSAHSSFPPNPQLVLLFFLGHCQSHRRPLFPPTLARTNLNGKHIVHPPLFPMSQLVSSIPFCILHLPPMLLGLL